MKKIFDNVYQPPKCKSFKLGIRNSNTMSYETICYLSDRCRNFNNKRCFILTDKTSEQIEKEYRLERFNIKKSQ